MKTDNVVSGKQPSVEVIIYNEWIVKDDFENPVNEGEQVFVLNCGATIHMDAAEDYLIEKLDVKFSQLLDWSKHVKTIIVFQDGTWIYEKDIHAYFIEVLGAHVYERKSVNTK